MRDLWRRADFSAAEIFYMVLLTVSATALFVFIAEEYQEHRVRQRHSQVLSEYNEDLERGLDFHLNWEEEKRLWGISDVYIYREGPNLTPEVWLEIYSKDPETSTEEAQGWSRAFVTPDQLSYAAPERELRSISGLGNDARVHVQAKDRFSIQYKKSETQEDEG